MGCKMTHPCRPAVDILAVRGFSFILTDGHSKKEFARKSGAKAKTHPHSRDTRFTDPDELMNACALHDDKCNVKAFAPAGYVVLDIDKHKDKGDGFKSLADAGHERGRLSCLAG